MQHLTRRKLIAGLTGAGVATSAGAALLPGPAPSAGRNSFIDILRAPNLVRAFSGLDHRFTLQRSTDTWSGGGVQVRFELHADGIPIHLAASSTQPTHVQIRWNAAIHEDLLLLCDAWERSYGDLHWNSMVPERAMPWYFLLYDGSSLHGYGVKTGAAALCFWQIDPQGISLWLNVCNGGSGVALGDRELLAATVVTLQGTPGDNLFRAAHAFCRKLCGHPRAAEVIYGSNDWYYAYGQNSAAQIVRDAELVASLAPSQGPRPFTVIDDGWKNKSAYPDMGALAAAIRSHNVRPGLWIRPLQAALDTPEDLLLPAARYGRHAERQKDLAYDPTVPDALQTVLAKVSEATRWGYELIKHDFSTYELLGQWGFEMGPEPTLPGWSLHDRSKTNAEIIRDLYLAIRRTAGDRTLIIGCNSIGHLGAGIFDAQRIGDDVSGQLWERTRRMGVNTLAYRLPQHHAFFALDADCVPITTDTPWSCNSQWLDLVARSGTVLLVSPQPAAMGPEQREGVRSAFAVAASANNNALAVDWQTSTTPDHWEFRGSSSVHKNYDWYQNTGAWPFHL
jgi:alpha-galactosidase